LAGERVASAPAGPDPFEPFVGYVRARLTEDLHLWAQTLFDEVVALGYDKAYSTFNRQVRSRGLRPHCEPWSRPRLGRASAVIEHPAISPLRCAKQPFVVTPRERQARGTGLAEGLTCRQALNCLFVEG
jgi:hypothetical protein